MSGIGSAVLTECSGLKPVRDESVRLPLRLLVGRRRFAKNANK